MRTARHIAWRCVANGVLLLGLALPLCAEDLASELSTEPPPEPRRLRVALLQILPEGDDEGANLARAEAWCRRAAAVGADIALLPEMYQIGYQGYDEADPEAALLWQDRAIPVDHPWLRRLRDLAVELDMAIGATYLARQEGAPGNAFTLFDRRGRAALTYHKVNLCDFTFESACEPGDAFHVCTLDTGRGPVEVGAMICYDRIFPDSMADLIAQGAELILIPMADRAQDADAHELRAYAADHRVTICAVNYPEPMMGGASAAYGPLGETLAVADESEALLIADVDLEAQRSLRAERPRGAGVLPAYCAQR